MSVFTVRRSEVEAVDADWQEATGEFAVRPAGGRVIYYNGVC